MRRFGRGVGVILVASVLFGAMAVCVRAAAADMAPLQVACVRFCGALAVMLLTAGRRSLRPRRARYRWLIARGLLGAGAISLWFHGIRDAGAAVATVLHSTYPVWATSLAVVLLGERFSRRIALALALELAGVALIVGPGGGSGPDATRGALLSLAAGALAGAAVTTARQLRGSEGATVITTWFMLTGAVVTAPAFLSPVPPLSGPLAGALAGVVLFSVAGQWLLHHGLGHTTAAQGSLAAATSIVTAAVLEAAWLGGGLGGDTLAGGACMVAAVALAASHAPSPAAAGGATAHSARYAGG